MKNQIYYYNIINYAKSSIKSYTIYNNATIIAIDSKTSLIIKINDIFIKFIILLIYY